MLAADRNRTFGSWLAAAVLLFFAFQLADICFDLRQPDQNALLIHIFSGTITPVLSVSPVLAALPFATGFARDWRSGMAVNMLIRSGRRRFFASKILCCAIGGGLALALGSALYAVFLNFWFSHDYADYVQMIQQVAFYNFSAGVNVQSLVGYYCTVVLLQFMAGVFWSICAMMISAFVPNVSITLCAPLVVYKLAEEAVDFLPVWLSPYLLQTGNVGLSVPLTIAAAAAVFLGGAALMAAVFWLRANKRLSST